MQNMLILQTPTRRKVCKSTRSPGFSVRMTGTSVTGNVRVARTKRSRSEGMVKVMQLAPNAFRWQAIRNFYLVSQASWLTLILQDIYGIGSSQMKRLKSWNSPFAQRRSTRDAARVPMITSFHWTLKPCTTRFGRNGTGGQAGCFKTQLTMSHKHP